MGATVWKAVAAPRGARGGGGERSEPDPTETPREGDGSAVAVWAAVWARRAASRLGQARRAASWPGGRSGCPVLRGVRARTKLPLIAQ